MRNIFILFDSLFVWQALTIRPQLRAERQFLFIIIGFKHIDYYSGNYFVSADIKWTDGGGVVQEKGQHCLPATARRFLTQDDDRELLHGRE